MKQNQSLRETDFRDSWLTRNQWILDWLLHGRSFIICLQEFWVGNEEIMHMYQERLGEAGYMTFKLARTNNRGDCLLFSAVYKRNQKENNVLRLELQPRLLFNYDELSTLQFLIDGAQGPSCSNDSSRSQLYIRDQEDDLFDSMWASGEDQHLHEENIQTRLHDFEPMKSLSGYIADSSNSPVAQSGSSRNGSIVLQAFGHHFKPDKPKELPEKPREHHSCF
ncbi:hypothetical protein QYF36_008496 [Acer negundo]|nr:hypothetical protein QYF36_008496 [Acer negundo]